MSAAPTSAGPAGPPPGTYSIPSLGWRILGGALRLIPLALLLLGVPLAILTFLQSQGISLPIPIPTVELFGIALTALIVARYIARPSVAYGPLSIATDALTIVYLYLILLNATYHLTVPGAGLTISVDYSTLVLLLLTVPALALAAGAITLTEDLLHPRERWPFDFPP
ncbi:MAG TPA: hypothetical protein VMC82_03175 [Thermoplasmata archaeon]|nr:hypothetical protein [Thermoplasmata archaeon]